MKFILRAKTRTLKGDILLPASKSISNRVLIIRALANRPFEIENLSEADDTVIMQRALDRNDMITDVGPAGTVMRFLTAFYASRPGEKVLTGSARMKKRPIAPLVDALESLGAKITYIERKGYPPLHIEGRRLHGGTVKVSGTISSQFITALMLIGPTLPQPLIIQIEGDPLSRPYIIMTKALMEHFGAQVDFEGTQIVVHPGRYRAKKFVVEQDWSAAAFWMSFAALSRRANLRLIGLQPESIQGDRVSLDLYNAFGVQGKFEEGGLVISKNGAPSSGGSWDFRDHPDLVQPSAVAAAALGMEFSFSGLDNLRLKETDRVAALQKELEKVGVGSIAKGNVLTLDGKKLSESCPPFDAHDDHRMVMSIASLCMIYPEVVIRDPMVVAKSYPGFWKEVEKFVDVRPGK